MTADREICMMLKACKKHVKNKRYRKESESLMWMWLVLLYGVLKGVREIVKKKSLEKSTVMEVLFFYTLFGLCMVLPTAKQAAGVPLQALPWIAVKSFAVFLAWIFSFHAIRRMPISLYGVLDLSRVLFATLLGTWVLGEVLGWQQVVGLIFVAAGLLLLKYQPKRKDSREEVAMVYVICAFASCMLNALSGLLDKILMRTVTSTQLQFWYMLFMVLMYLAYIVVTRTKLHWKNTLKNQWIWLLSLLFVIADKALFIANGMEGSKVTVMTLIKQSGCVVTILAGKFIFREKNVGYKLFCAAVIITGIVAGCSS